MTKREMIELCAKEIRDQLAIEEAKVRNLADNLKDFARATDADGLPPNPHEAGLRAEAIGQAMLAVRHIEDARMRLGKVLQYAVQGGVEYGNRTEG